MRIIVLGSAAGGGFPQWNCACANCSLARSGSERAKPRTQSSLAVSRDGERWLLLNASPDLRQQILATPALHPLAENRHSPIAEVLLTNADVDHIAGLLTLREGHRFTLYGTDRVLSAIGRNQVFEVLAADLVQRRRVTLGQAYQSETGLSVEAFAVPGKAALYLEDTSRPDLGTEREDTLGLSVADPASGANFLYVPACAALTPELTARMRHGNLLFFDGTLWRDDEMIAAGLRRKTGLRMGHISISGPEGSLAGLADVGTPRKIYIHINNSNPVLIEDSPERREVERGGWEVAHDGMEIRL